MRSERQVGAWGASCVLPDAKEKNQQGKRCGYQGFARDDREMRSPLLSPGNIVRALCTRTAENAAVLWGGVVVRAAGRWRTRRTRAGSGAGAATLVWAVRVCPEQAQRGEVSRVWRGYCDGKRRRRWLLSRSSGAGSGRCLRRRRGARCRWRRRARGPGRWRGRCGAFGGVAVGVVDRVDEGLDGGKTGGGEGLGVRGHGVPGESASTKCKVHMNSRVGAASGSSTQGRADAFLCKRVGRFSWAGWVCRAICAGG